MNTKSLFHVFLFAGCTAFLAPASMAGQEESALLKEKIQHFYSQMSQGDWQGAFQFISAGSSGYLPHGMLKKIPSDSIKSMIVEKKTAEHAGGQSVRIWPKNIEVKMLGDDHALATYYVEGSRVSDGKEKHVMNRASLVLAKKDDNWQIVHWHASPLDCKDSGE